jgi:hypothetical protein
MKVLVDLRSAQAEYPADLRAATRSALLRHIEAAESTSPWDRFRVSIERLFHYKTTFPTVGRLSLVVASLIAVVLIGSLFIPRVEQAFQPYPLQTAEATHLPQTSTSEVAITICRADDQSPSCRPGDPASSQDLADTGNGAARPAVSKDARADPNAVHKAAYVNDGRGGASWVSNSADSWIKIDLGEVKTINTINLQKGSLGSSGDNDPGQFVIAVALSDEYADGDSNHDYVEYTQVFRSEATGFSGMVSQAETISTRFPAMKARFVKITFEKAGAAIEEVGVFMVEPPSLTERATSTPQDDLAAITSTPIFTGTSLAMNTATSLPAGTTVVNATNTLAPSRTMTPLPTNTLPPAYTSTIVPTDPLPSDTPLPPPTVVQPTVGSIDPIVVTGSDQIMTFTCNGNDAVIRGHANTVTLLGSCTSITVTGNGNRVFWESGSPVITNKGKDNIIQQL